MNYFFILSVALDSIIHLHNKKMPRCKRGIFAIIHEFIGRHRHRKFANQKIQRSEQDKAREENLREFTKT